MKESMMTQETLFETLVQMTHRFHWYLDEFRYHDMIEMMREDCVWHRQGKVLKGREQVLAALNERPVTQRIRHLISNPFIAERKDNSVRLIAYMLGYKADEGVKKPAPQTIDGPLRLLLLDVVFEFSGGRWWIVEQKAIPEFEFRSPAPVRG
jgi:hypothetical protein